LLTWTGGAAARPAQAGATSAQDSPPDAAIVLAS